MKTKIKRNLMKPYRVLKTTAPLSGGICYIIQKYKWGLYIKDWFLHLGWHWDSLISELMPTYYYIESQKEDAIRMCKRLNGEFDDDFGVEYPKVKNDSK